MAGPFKFATKPHTIGAQAGKLAATTGEATLADSEILATNGKRIGRSRSRWAILAVAILALAVAGWVIHRKKATT